MLINAEFKKPVIVLPFDYNWVNSTQSGVTRMMLDRIGAEKARATSLVHYEQAASFPAHGHPGGEEIFVLSGTFSDESGDYPQGYYIRNPVGSSHTPTSHEGTLIFVKLWQMDPEDTQFTRVNTYAEENWKEINGRWICPLYSGFNEQVFLQRLNTSESLSQTNSAQEILVLEGELRVSQTISAKPSQDCKIDTTTFPKGSWMRFPENYSINLAASQTNTTLFIKQGPFKNTHFEQTP